MDSPSVMGFGQLPPLSAFPPNPSDGQTVVVHGRTYRFVLSIPAWFLDGPGGGGGATVTVGTTTTLPPGFPANVTNTGTPQHAILNFFIPGGGTVGPSPGHWDGGDLWNGGQNWS